MTSAAHEDGAASGPATTDPLTVSLARRPPGVPRKFIALAVVAVVVLGGGGVLLERVFTSAGLNAYSVSASSRATTVRSTTPHSTTLAAPLRSFMDLSPRSGSVAPQFTLLDQSGHRTSLASLRGKVVVLTFFDAACDDICPVVGAEIRRAEQALGGDAPRVAFVAVNTDPEALSAAWLSRTTGRLGLGRYPNWYFLTGGIGALDVVWTHYGITIEVSRASHHVAHTEAMYFLDGSQRERFEVTPFGNERLNGPTTLAPASIARFGAGIATYARELLH
ncbi:MAG TPA: SCO family protein [Acidimicrobiales bacterium]|nr:SCO family protein [Acidimicrobiales bacterium]